MGLLREDHASPPAALRWLLHPWLLCLLGCSGGITTGGQSFGDPGAGSGPGPHPDPYSVALEFTVRNEASVDRTETVRVSVPFPYGGYPDLGNVAVAGHATSWLILQRWPDGTVRVAQAQFDDTLPAGAVRTYQVTRGNAALSGAFTQNAWVAGLQPGLQIGAEVQDTFGVAYRAFVGGSPEELVSTPLVRVRRHHLYHLPVSGPGIGRDYLTSTFYLTEFRDMPVMLVDWVVGNDYQGADVIQPGDPNRNLRPLGMIDVRDARFLVRGVTGATPYLQVQDSIGNAQLQADGFFAFPVLQNTWLEDGQTRRYRFVLYFEDPAAPPSQQNQWRAGANAMIEYPLFPLATQPCWQSTGAAGLLGGPIPGPVDAWARAEGDYAAWRGYGWFGTWGSRSDPQVTGTTGTPRNHPLSPELAHAIQANHPRLLQKLEQMAWAQAMRPYHLWDLHVGAEQDILLWDGVPIYPGSRDLSHESLGRRALWASDPYAAYRTMTQPGGNRAHGWEHFDEEHWSTDLLFDYYTVSGDQWAREELRQLGESLKSLMRLRTYSTAWLQAVRAEGWTMQGFTQVYVATGDEAVRDYALRRVHEIVDVQRQNGHPSHALAFQSNYPGTGFPMPHEFYMPWQHGALLYGYLGAYRFFRDPLILQICEDTVTCVEYAWVSNYRDPALGFVPEGLRYYVPTKYNGVPIPADYFDGTVGVHWGDSPLGGAHTFLIGGLFLLTDWSGNSDVRGRAFHYGQLLMPGLDDNLRWNKWNYCVPDRFTH